MNALGVEVENRLGSSIMSGLHGMWSAGALIGSAAGTLAAHLGTDARLHHGWRPPPSPCSVWPAAGCSTCGPPRTRRPAAVRAAARSALLIGAVGFCAVFAEGASLDWSAVYLQDRLGTSAGLAAACTTGFMLTMAVARLVGDAVVNRFGAVRTVRAGGVLAAGAGC